MDLPKGTLKRCGECRHIRPADCLLGVDSSFSGIIQLFKRGEMWNVFFFLIEDGFLIGYCAIRGDNSLESVLFRVIERCEVEMRAFCLQEMKIARSLNAECLLPMSLQISEVLEENSSEETKMNLKVKSSFQGTIFRAEINEARKFREDFLRRRSARDFHL